MRRQNENEDTSTETKGSSHENMAPQFTDPEGRKARSGRENKVQSGKAYHGICLVIEDACDKTGVSGNSSSLGDWAASTLRGVTPIKY